MKKLLLALFTLTTFLVNAATLQITNTSNITNLSNIKTTLTNIGSGGVSGIGIYNGINNFTVPTGYFQTTITGTKPDGTQASATFTDMFGVLTTISHDISELK